MAADVTVVFDDAAIKLTCEDPGSEVGRAMGRLADSAVLTMKYLCPVAPRDQAGPTAGHPRQVARRSGTLRSSIRKFRQSDGGYLVGPTDLVGPPWGPPRFLAELIENGTSPHEITSHGPWPLYSTTTRTAYGHRVWHPGTRANPFIRRTAESLNGVTIHL